MFRKIFLILVSVSAISFVALILVWREPLSVAFEISKDAYNAKQDSYAYSIASVNEGGMNIVDMLNIEEELLVASSVLSQPLKVVEAINEEAKINLLDTPKEIDSQVKEVVEKKAEKPEIISQDIIQEEGIKLLFLGDIMLDRHVGAIVSQHGVKYLLNNLDQEDFFDNYDLISSNLEGAVTVNGDHYNPYVGHDFAFSPEVVKDLRDYNFNFFNIANNHLSDQGNQGVIETRANLDSLNFKFSGCQDRKVGNCTYRAINIKGKTFAFLGLSKVYGDINFDNLEPIIKRARDFSDYVIVNIHWGVEYKHNAHNSQISLAHKLINNGVDVIIGHHPHVVQGIEIYKNKPIFYSLGNFIFDQYFSQDTQEGLSVALTVQHEELKINLEPYKSNQSVLDLMDQVEKDIFFENLMSWSYLETDNVNYLKEEIVLVE